MTTAILVVIVFLACNLFIGFRASRRATSETMMNGGRKSGLWLLMFSTFATSIGAGDLFSYPSLGYLQGWSGLHFILAMPVIIIVMAFTVGKAYYRMNVRTISDLLCSVYGEHTALRVFSGLCMAVGLFATTAGQYSAFGKSLHLLTGLPTLPGMFIGALVFVSYTVAGGLGSVMAVSFLQGILMIAGIVLVYAATGDAAGGYAFVQSALPADYHTFFGASGAVTIVTYWINRGLSKFTNFSYWQRLSSAKNEKTGVWGVSLGMAVTGILGILLALIGMNMFVAVPGMSDPEMIFVEATKRYFPKPVFGVLLGAIWAAILSSAGGFLNSASTIICNDIWLKAMGHEGDGEPARKRAARCITAMIGAVTFCIAWLFPSVLDLLVWSGVCLTPTLIPVLLAAIFDKQGRRIDHKWLLAGMILSAATGIVFETAKPLKAVTGGGTIPAFLVSAVVIAAGMLVHRRNNRNDVQP